MPCTVQSLWVGAKLSDIEINIMIDQNLFKIQNYIN